jgi:cytochrome c oxidase subunit 3
VTDARAEPREHFEDLAQQAHAARLGMWVFLASELLLFTTVFALYASTRAAHPAVFHAAVQENDKLLGSINTAVLLVSSTIVATGVSAMREGKARAAAGLVATTIALGAVFLGIKLVEWGHHLEAGLGPRRAEFWSLYFGMTGLHAIHVIVGMGVLAAMLVGIARGTVRRETAHRLEIGAVYWHLVDVIWIFLWPLFYLS